VSANSPPASSPIDLLKLPPEERDAAWVRHVYAGDGVPQLTVRAVVMGGLLGMAMSVANLYTTLKLGWAFGVAITACVLSYAIWNGLVAARVAKTKMTMLENNCMQSTASAAGYSTGGTLATAVGALLLIQGDDARMGWVPVTFWVALVALLGVELPFLFSGALVAETIFAWPGMGRLFVDALTMKEYPILMGMMMFTAIFVIVGNLLADIAIAAIDPRVRLS